MASLRNAVKRRIHHERVQPRKRSRLGQLEHHKDYAARARNYNEKKKQLKILQEKAAMRNPDEFYFGMISAKVKVGTRRGTPVLARARVCVRRSRVRSRSSMALTCSACCSASRLASTYLAGDMPSKNCPRTRS